MTIKVISLNLWWGGNLFPEILTFLGEQDADIVALQEVHDGSGLQLQERQQSMRVLRGKLHYPHDNFTQAFVLSAPEGEIPLGNAVLSKFPITQHSRSFLFEPTLDEYRDIAEQWPFFPRAMQYTRLDTPAGELNVFNMHGVWDLDGDNPSENRQKMFDIITQQTQGKPNVLLMGDSNASKGNPLWRTLDGHLKDAFDGSLLTTFNMRRKSNPGYATAAVDVLYVSPHVEVLSAESPDVDISDHLPLVASLKID